ncbi:YncE family protein [Bacillus sp. Marseille-P3800]|uniref:YncE family protein n=1 Tax=Bacillus sp. Marseille-P3800 TaxID=2014782 RepID=UPI000C0819DF|nr:hypothetical protein [Bacillus sp. Marseille-P3800]
MKRSLYAIVATFFLTFLSSCAQDHVQTPSEEGGYFLVSHLKEASLGFINENSMTVTSLSSLPTVWEQIIKINETEFLILSDQTRTLSHFDLHTGDVTPLTEFDDMISDIVYDARATNLIVSYTNTNKLAWISLEGEVMETVTIENRANDLYVDNDRLFVLNADEASVDVISLTSLEIEHTIPVVERASGMFFDGELLWVGGHGPTGELNQSVVGYSLASEQEEERIPIGLMPIALGGNQSEASMFVISHGNDHLYKIDTSSQEVLKEVEVGHNPNYLHVDDDYVIVSNFDSQSLSVFSSDSLERIAEIDVGAGPHVIVSGEMK